MTPLYLRSGRHSVAATFEPAEGAARDTAVLLVPPFGWDDQTSYRPRRDWSMALAAAGFPNLRIDLPGTGDSSGDVRDDGLVDDWSAAVASAISWLRNYGAARVAVIAIGLGGLLTLKALRGGATADDLVLWGMPASGRAFAREFKAFGWLEQAQTGELSSELPAGELRAGGHVLTASTAADVSKLDAAALMGSITCTRVMLLGRDGSGPDAAVMDAVRAAGAEMTTDPGRGWGAALARPQSISPTPIFDKVHAWLAGAAAPASAPMTVGGPQSASIGTPQGLIRETAAVFDGAGQQLYAIISEPLGAPPLPLTLILYNAGAIRRIGPGRMWTEAARRWAAAGVSVMRVDIEGIGDAGGDGSAYRDSDDPFYDPRLVGQARAALEFAVERSLPNRFVLGGLCSGAFWAFQSALADPRVKSVVMLNPRLLFFDAHTDARRELHKLKQLFTPKTLRAVQWEKLSLRRAARLGTRLIRRSERPNESAAAALARLKMRGQEVTMAFSGEEPLRDELQRELGSDRLGVRIVDLPCKSHTLKPLQAQQAGHAVIDEAVAEALRRLETASLPCLMKAQPAATALS